MGSVGRCKKNEQGSMTSVQSVEGQAVSGLGLRLDLKFQTLNPKPLNP